MAAWRRGVDFMRSCGFKPWAGLLAVAALLVVGGVRAALPIELEVAAQQDAPFGAMQEWGRVLSGMDLARVRLRGARGDDHPAVEPSGDGGARIYRVTGVLNRRDELVLPGGTFRETEAARLRQFFESLPERVEESAIQRGPFGVETKALAPLVADLATPVGDATAGRPTAEVVAALVAGIETRVAIGPDMRDRLAAAPQVTAELKGLAHGTALAAVLRAANLALVPRHEREQPVVLDVASLDDPRAAWPVGWKPRGAPRQVAPAMYKVTTVEIAGYPLAKALAALEPHLGVPLVLDALMLAERQIDPARGKVKFPAERTYIRRAVDRLLAQSRLAGELRVDDGGRPFYWVTQYGPRSPRANELRVASSE